MHITREMLFLNILKGFVALLGFRFLVSAFAAFILENFKGGPVAPLTLKEGVIFRNQGVILTQKSSTVNLASISPTCLIKIIN
jgi:hypothetical protein